MATASPAASNVHEEVPVPESDEEERPPGFSPQGSRTGSRDEYEGFLRFLRQSQSRRGRLPRDASEDEDGISDRTNAGPPPSWDGNTSFKDYLIRAKLWMVTTKTKPRARGPLLLKNLSGIPFDSMKYLARDDAWLKDEHNGEKLLKLMDTKELFGEDDREDMLASLVKITYGLRRAKNEDYQSFFHEVGQFCPQVG